jgi:hypothetical protein
VIPRRKSEWWTKLVANYKLSRTSEVEKKKKYFWRWHLEVPKRVEWWTRSVTVRNESVAKRLVCHNNKKRWFVWTQHEGQPRDTNRGPSKSKSVSYRKLRRSCTHINGRTNCMEESPSSEGDLPGFMDQECSWPSWQQPKTWVISGFLRGVNDIYALLRSYTA